MKIITLILSTVFLSGCGISSYFTKKSCTNTNWFEAGKKTALSAQRIDSNHMYNKCKSKGYFVNDADIDRGFKAGVAIYCDPQEAYTRGRNAKPNRAVKDFCEPNAVRQILSEYNRGVKDFCQKSAGYQFATEGNEYPTGFCPQSLEKRFLSGYNKGRITYLKSAIIENESRFYSIDSEISELEGEKSDHLREMAYLPRQAQYVKKSVYNTETGQYETITVANENNAATERYQDLDDKVKRIESKVRSLKSDKNKINQNNAHYKKEIMRLENQTL